MRRAALAVLAVWVTGAGLLEAGPEAMLSRAQFRKEALAETCRIEFEVGGVPRGLHILFNYHSKGHFAALRLDGGKARLSEVVGGKVRELPLTLPVSGRGTLFLRPGHLLVRSGAHAAGAALRVAAGGKYGASFGTSGKLTQLLMRREEPIYFTDGFMRSDDGGEHWHPQSGKWSIRFERDTARSANPFRCIARSTGPGLMTTGEGWWHEYAFSVNVTGKSGSAGLAFAVTDKDTYHLFRTGVGAGVSELVRVRDGKETVLARDERVLYADRWYKLSVRADAGGVVCSVDGESLFRRREVAAVGRVGLYVSHATETLFDDVEVVSSYRVAQRKPPIELFSTVFESDQQMENWASLWGAWRPQVVSGPGRSRRRVYWHKGDFFGDVSIGVKLAAGLPKSGELGLLVGGDGADVTRGARLTVRGGGAEPSWTLRLAGRTLGTKAAAAPAGTRVALSAEGGRLVARADGRVVLRSEPVKLPGRAVALWGDGVPMDLHKVEIRSENVHDYLFEQAPVEWFPRTGTWQITNRWVCDPRWSWLGGSSKQVAQMWSKRAFHGDQTVEFFAGLKMRTGVRYPHVGDINLTICGDGRNLDSGYQVVFAGWGNRWTRILREGRTVAGSADAVIKGSFHRRWFHIKLRKAGGLVQLYLDNQLVRQVRDPKPLGGGHIALWTVDNGIMIARARVYSEQSKLAGCLKRGGAAAKPVRRETAGEVPAGYLVSETFLRGPGPVSGRDGEQGARVEPVRGGGLVLVNENCGGSFGATLYDRAFDALKYPVVRLSYKVASADPVRLNLFVRVNGRLFEVPLTAPAEPDVAVTLGKAPKGVAFHGRPDETVRHVEVDLVAGLTDWYQARYRRKPLALSVSELYLANASNRKYLMCGLGGNRAGARLHLVGLAIRAREP